MLKLGHLRSRIMIPLLGLFAVAALLAGAAWFTLGAGCRRIVGGVWIGDMAVGGLSKTQAYHLVDRRFVTLQSKPLAIRYQGRTWILTPQQAGITLDARGVVDGALSIGHQGTLWTRIRVHWEGAKKVKRLTLPLHTDSDSWMRYASALQTEVDGPAVSARIEWRGKEGAVLVPHRLGRQIQVETLLRRVQAAALRDDHRDTVLPVKVATPALLTRDLESGDFSHLIAQYSTRFDEGNVDRSYNVRIAASAFSGLVIHPGDVVSFNSIVGPRVIEKGYRPAPVVLRGELVPDIGGGVCQVSSTLYNAVLLAGLQIVSKRSHSLPVVYVPLGRDATVTSEIDFKFKNDGSAPLYLSTDVVRGIVTVRLLGPSRGGSWIRLSTKELEEIPPGELIEVDSSLRPGQRVVSRAGVSGHKVELWRELFIGPLMVKRELVGRITYRPVATIVKVGPQSVPSEEPSRDLSIRGSTDPGTSAGSDR